jgi:microtubule-associated protein-like 6
MADGPGGSEFDADAQRCYYDKQTGEEQWNDGGKDEDGPLDDFFEVEDAEGDQFMAVRPWIGQVAEPDNHNEVNTEQPDTTYTLQYVYGYRSEDSRQNVYFNNAGKVTYMTAALGVILDQDSNEQTYFGGGEVDSTAKNVANDENGHTDDIMCIALSGDRTRAVTG